MALVTIYNETLDKFKKELENVDGRIDEYSEYMKLHPERKGDIRTLIYVRDNVYKMALITCIRQLRRERELVFSIMEKERNR